MTCRCGIDDAKPTSVESGVATTLESRAAESRAADDSRSAIVDDGSGWLAVMPGSGSPGDPAPAVVAVGSDVLAAVIGTTDPGDCTLVVVAIVPDALAAVTAVAGSRALG
jgi:hypothetical protein